MLFALEYLNRMEKKYPGVLQSIASQPDIASSYLAMAQLGVDRDDFNLMVSLRAWSADKVMYSFERGIAAEVTTQTENPDYQIPVSFMKHLPYPCFAVRLAPFSLLDPQSHREIVAYTGNAFIWIAEGQLISTWEVGDGQFDWTVLDLDRLSTFDDCFDALIRRHLMMAGIADEEIPLVLRLLRVDRFGDLTELTSYQFSRLSNRFGERKAQAIIDGIKSSNAQEQLLQRVIHIILYLNCTNADIEAAEEKLKTGAWSSIVGGDEVEYVPKTVRRRALREAEGAKVLDVGYRIGGKFKRSYSEEPNADKPSDTAIGSRGYSKRRAHYHHFWIGPRKGPIAEDIMNPAPGERGLVLYWLEATEIHPELKDDLATVVNVERQND